MREKAGSLENGLATSNSPPAIVKKKDLTKGLLMGDPHADSRLALVEIKKHRTLLSNELSSILPETGFFENHRVTLRKSIKS
ncbi:MAG: hypothetical protein A2521_08010 [Deltaproteobacteria bacterium RIFOXYD12_FULL_57_12]|nr:MAG: hypothetical protein A2521_08010 [Deltaproteobacteria bacterium RIFOXYD12_FULL_57_12]